jgi:hypothetical protein
MLYSAQHKELARSYASTFKTLSQNARFGLPSSAKAEADHATALLNLRSYLDAIGVHMPKVERIIRT